MKRLLVSAAAVVTAMAFMAPAQAVDAGTTQEGPYGPVHDLDFGTCLNTWADMNVKTTYYVKKASGGVTQVQFDLTGSVTSIAGQSPGACNDGTDNGSTVKDGIKGKMVQNFYIEVTGGKFNSKAKCDDACATDYMFGGVQTFVDTFFKGTPTWAFSATKLAHEIVTSTDKKLCSKKWEVLYNPADGTLSEVSGDIATKCA
jgi:hypothetical protein